MKMSLQSNDKDLCTVKLSGEFDANGCKEIREEFENIAKEFTNQKIELDLHDTTFIDSSGIGAIVYLFKRINTSKGTLHLTNVRGQPQELLSLLRVDEAIPISWHDESHSQAS